MNFVKIFRYPGNLNCPSNFNFENATKASIVENIGVEPMTSCVQGRRSSQLS